MDSVHLVEALAKQLPIAELHEALDDFLEPLARQLPERRLRRVARTAVEGILAASSPLVSQMARALAHTSEDTRSTAQQLYRFLWNKRFSHRHLLRALYTIAQRTVARYQPDDLLVAVDPVNFEKPYTHELEGVSTVMKSTPPSLTEEKRLTRGYPAITATIVNLPEPAISYARWFSYQTPDFVSENHEIRRALHTTRALFPGHRLRFLGDAGLDDQKIFRWAAQGGSQFIIRAYHRDRLVEIYNPRLDRWEQEHLGDLADTVPLPVHRQVVFTHAHRQRTADIRLGWFAVRLPVARGMPLGVLVAREEARDRDFVLLTNVPLEDAATAEEVYSQWRFRPQIEHLYRFDQERGLDVEDIQVHTLERMRRLFALVLLAALFVYHVQATWPASAACWLCDLGGQLAPALPAGPYVLLAGIGMVFVAVTTIIFARHHPFPRASPTCE